MDSRVGKFGGGAMVTVSMTNAQLGLYTYSTYHLAIYLKVSTVRVRGGISQKNLAFGFYCPPL